MPFVFLCDLGVSLFLCVDMVRDRPFRADREAVVFVSRRRRGFVSGGPGNSKGWREFPFRPRACSQGRKGNSAPIASRRFPATPAFVVARSAQPRTLCVSATLPSLR